MKTYTAMETLSRIQGELWWTTRLLARAEAKFDEKSETQLALFEVEKVIRAMIEEVGRIIREASVKGSNQRNIRQAEEFALKAKIAKATGDSLHAAASIPDGPSHK